MLWFLVWTLLVLLAAAVLVRLGWSVIRKGTALAREMGEAAELLGRAAEQVELLAPQAGAEPAVFSDPHLLRRERARASRRERRAGRRTRV